MEIKKLIKCLDTNKVARINTIPPKLMKIVADFLTPLLTAVLNIFSDSAKIASVVSLDKRKTK